jgi:phage shock protein A
LSATVFSSVDRVVSEIENHDAVVEASIHDHQRALAKARVRFNRLRADGERLAQRLEQLRKAEAQWARRAADQAKQDEQTALQCLQKRRDCRKQIADLEKSLAEHRDAESRLAGELQTMEEHINRIGQQRNLLRTRQSTAEAMRTFKAMEDWNHIDIDDTFEKWEVKVMEAEMASGGFENFEAVDDLEQQFLDAEAMEELKTELAELTKGEQQ